MKKSLYSILALMAMLLAFTSCEKDEIENTAIVTMAGEWDVVVDAVDENGNVLYEDPYGAGTVQIATYNLASAVGVADLEVGEEITLAKA